MEFLDVTHITENIDRISFKKKQEFDDSPLTNNLPIATFVTSLARLHLYSFLEKLEARQALYVDTDSLIFIHEKSKPLPFEIGDSLGQMSREYPNDTILEYISAGPKNYGLKIRKNGEINHVLKIRGFGLNYKTEKVLSYKNMRKMVLSRFGSAKKSYLLNVPYTRFCRTKTGVVYNSEINKKYRVVYTKGIITTEMFCLPFGFIGKKINNKIYQILF